MSVFCQHYCSELVGQKSLRLISPIECLVSDNPVDCASRGLFPFELLEHQLWWKGPDWLRLAPTAWPHQSALPPNETSEEEKEISLHTITHEATTVIDTKVTPD